MVNGNIVDSYIAIKEFKIKNNILIIKGVIDIKKNRKIIILLMTILGGVIIFLSIGRIGLSKQTLDIPKKNTISSIKIYSNYIDDTSKYHFIEHDKDISEIYDILLSSKKTRTIKSVDDSPSNVDKELTKLVLIDGSNNTTSLFIYQGNDGKYYIEKPYESIYRLSVQEYKKIAQYFIES